MRNIEILKEMLKEMAEKIKQARKAARMLKEAGHGNRAHGVRLDSRKDSRDYRCHHIAYCELRGKTRDQIERPRVQGGFLQFRINKEVERIKALYAWTPEEIAKYNERKAKHEEAICVNS